MLTNDAPQQDNKPVKDYAYHAKDWESSGMNQKAYCQSKGLNYPRFVTSRSRLLDMRDGARKAPPKFIPVRTAQPGASTDCAKLATEPSAIILRLPQGSVVEIPSTLKPAQLSTLLRCLGGILC